MYALSIYTRIKFSPMSNTLQPTLHHIHCPDKNGGHRMAYWQWGDAAHPHVVVCAHGLSRQGRDFDKLAKALIGPSGNRCRVISADIAGRGQSDWLADPLLYVLPTYAVDMGLLLAHLLTKTGAKTLDWVGTSMGGLIGMGLCGQPQSPVRKLVINDVGPVLQYAALQRIGTYLGADPRFDTEQQAVDYLWKLSVTFGPHTPEQWLALSRPMLRKDGAHYKLHYDPAIGIVFKAATPEQTTLGEAALWQLYDNIKAQTLITRGVQSDLLTPETAHAMTQRGPRPRLVEFEGVGHAPTFVAQNQIDVVTQFIFGA
jgi:pimeloyl-ACP methyl ester carboxylesterase